MINRQDFNRALRVTVVILAVALFILGFLWINFLTTRFNMEMETFRQSSEAGIESTVEDKVQVVVRQADLLYQEETEMLKDVMINRMNVIKNNLFDYSDLPRDVLYLRLIDDGRHFYELSGIDEAIVSEKHNLAIGDGINSQAFRIQEFYDIGDTLYYSEYSAPARANVQLKVNQHDYLRARIKKWIRDYRELEPNLILLDQTGSPLADTVEVSNVFRQENYLALETSQLSGYTFGYYQPRSDLQNVLNERQAMFQRFLDNHVIEIAALLVLLIVTLAVFFGLIAKQHSRQLAGLNDEIIEHYRNPEADGGELYREYGLSRAVDSLVADARRNQQHSQMMERKHKKELKQARIEFLQMERRFEYLLNKEAKNQFTRFTPLHENIHLADMIRQAHQEFAPDAELSLYGDDESIVSDPAIMQTLIENFFRLSDHPQRHYQVESMVESGFVKLMFNLENSGAIEPADIERMKYLAGLLGGLVMRLSYEDGNFSLVLRLLNE